MRSAGSEPGSEVNPVIARVLAEVGLPVTDHSPTQLNYDLVDAADVVITLGCGESCPAAPGTRIEDWPVADPKGQDEATVRHIVADLDTRVRALLTEVAPQLPCAVGTRAAFQRADRRARVAPSSALVTDGRSAAPAAGAGADRGAAAAGPRHRDVFGLYDRMSPITAVATVPIAVWEFSLGIY